MKLLLFVAVLALSFSGSLSTAFASETVLAKKSKKSEPAPRDRDDRGRGEEPSEPYEETYEGNERDGGGYFDGGGYEGDGGGMIGELFSTKRRGAVPVTTHQKKEDRGSVIVYTTTIQQDLSADESCTEIIVTVVDKATGKVISTDRNEFCNRWPLEREKATTQNH